MGDQTAFGSSFRFNGTLNVVLNSISPNSTGSDPNSTQVTITGDGFDGTLKSNNKILIGNVTGNIIDVTKTQIIASFGYIPAGRQKVSVEVFGKGFAYENNPIIFNSKMSLVDISPLSGSYAGGQLITINGYGFSNQLSDNIVRICNNICQVTQATRNLI